MPANFCRFVLMVAFTTALFALPARAQQADCANPQTQTDMNICASQAYAAADLELNAAYKKARARMRGIGGDKLLLAAQRAWLKYRDAACAAEAFPYAGGSIQPLIAAQCKTRLTRTRTRDLVELAKEN